MATYRTPVEYYLQSIFKTHGLNILPKVYIEKILVLVNRKLEDPCCTDSSATIDLLTRKFNVVANTVETLLNLIPKNGNVQSLLRTKKLIENRLTCCENA